MLKTGEIICIQHFFPATDIYSYTFEGIKWVNTKWGFEVLAYLFSLIGGPEFTTVLQSIANVLILLIVFNTWLFIRNNILKNQTEFAGFSIIIASFLFLFINEFRMNGRPEMISHLLTLAFLNILLKARFKNAKLVFWIIPLQVVWTNFHEAYGMGMILMCAAVVAVWLENYFTKEIGKDASAIANVQKYFTLTALATVLAPSLHPSGIQMIYHPLNIFNQVKENTFTTEYDSFSDPGYWNYRSYLSMILFFVMIIYFLSNYKKENKNVFVNLINSFSVFSMIYFIFFILLFYLSLTALRNIPYLVIISTPIIALAIEKIFNLPVLKKIFVKNNLIYLLIIVFGLSSYYMIASDKYYKKFNHREHFGIMYSPDNNPVGAAQFLKDHAIKGEGFSDYLTSSYLLWKLYPGFKTFIDMRDLDVFTSAFFKSYFLISSVPQYFDSTDMKINYNYAVVFTSMFSPLHEHLSSSTKWDIVYADAVAVVYLKKNTINNKLIAQYGFHRNGKDVFAVPILPEQSRVSKLVTKLFWFPFDPTSKNEMDYDIKASDYYSMIHQTGFAISYAEKSIQKHPNNSSGWVELGNIYFIGAMVDSIDSIKTSHLNLAREYYTRAVNLDKKSAGGYFGLGNIELFNSYIKSAINFFEKCTSADPAFSEAYIKLAECQARISFQNPQKAKECLNKWLEYMEKAYLLQPDNTELTYQLGSEYCKNGNKRKAKKYLQKAINSGFIDSQRMANAQKCIDS